jgi:hypothetical protein
LGYPDDLEIVIMQWGDYKWRIITRPGRPWDKDLPDRKKEAETMRGADVMELVEGFILGDGQPANVNAAA